MRNGDAEKPSVASPTPDVRSRYISATRKHGICRCLNVMGRHMETARALIPPGHTEAWESNARMAPASTEIRRAPYRPALSLLPYRSCGCPPQGAMEPETGVRSCSISLSVRNRSGCPQDGCWICCVRHRTEIDSTDQGPGARSLTWRSAPGWPGWPGWPGHGRLQGRRPLGWRDVEAIHNGASTTASPH